MKDFSDRIASEAEISERIEARYSAEVIAGLADDEAKLHGNHVWKCLHDICCAHVPCKVEDEKRRKHQEQYMSDGEVQRFEREMIPFEAFRGKLVKDVPLERLQWYADQTFVDQLRRYLRSKRVQNEEAATQD
jgi:hypothetical protein